jgi:hypothetical protein
MATKTKTQTLATLKMRVIDTRRKALMAPPSRFKSAQRAYREALRAYRAHPAEHPWNVVQTAGQLQRVCAERWTRENLGSSGSLEEMAYEIGESAVNAEYREWQREAQVVVNHLVKSGIALTVNNAEKWFGKCAKGGC